MPAFHPEIKEPFLKACATALCPLKTTVSGPAPKSTEKVDIVDITLRYFKANVLFRKYPLREGDDGATDRTLLYLTYFAQACLRKLEEKKVKDQKEAERVLMMYALENFEGPGDASFVLQGFIPNASNSSEKSQWMDYMKQARQVLAQRIAEKVFQNSTDGPNKFWMQFRKQKFLGKEMSL